MAEEHAYEDELVAMLERTDKVRRHRALLLLGNPGIGKTQAVYRFAKKHNRRVVEMILSQVQPNEISGITMPNNETQSMQVFDHARLSSLQDGDILFLDEFLQARPAVQSACLTLIQERRMMSGKELPDIMIVAAANEDRDPSTISVAIRNRFKWHRIEWNRDAWIKYIKDTRGVDIPKTFLRSNIDFNGKDWNVMTPRNLTDYIDYILANKDTKALRDAVQEDITEEVNRMFAEELMKICCPEVDSKKLAFITEVNSIIAEISDPMNKWEFSDNYLEHHTFEDVLNELMKHPQWSIIQERLSEVKM